VYPITRRIVLRLGAGGLLGLTEAIASAAERALEPDGKNETRLNWQHFVDRVATLAESRATRDIQSEDFLRSTESVGAQIDRNDSFITGTFASMERRQAALHSHSHITRIVPKRTPAAAVHFEILLLTLESGYTIPFHDHPGSSVASICLSGTARVANYDLDGAANGPILKMRSRSTIGPTQTATLTEHRGNIHTITAVQTAEFIDIFSPPLTAGRFHWYDTARDPHSPEGKVLQVKSVRTNT
jgi:hypothetical protein